MKSDLRILMNEDSVRDAELLERELRQGGIAFSVSKVDTRADFEKQLDDFNPDLIISDYHLPSFDGLQALEIARSRSPTLPFILVSGYVGEERAIEALKKGATDFILKDRLGRLVACVQRALREVEERLEHQRLEKRFQLFVDSSPNAMVMIATSGLIEMINGQTERMFGFARDELSGRSIELLFPERFRGGHTGPPLAFFALSSGQTTEAAHDLFGRRSDGTEFPVEIELNPIDTDTGTEILYVIVDITTRREIEHEKDRQRRELERSNNDLEQFAYIASHDLQAPLGAIDNLAEWIRQDLGDLASPEIAHKFDLLQGRAARLQMLLKGLLTYSRNDRADSPIEDVNIPRLVREIALTLAPPPGFIITCIGPMQPVHSRVPPLRMLLENLISNGLKHHDRDKGQVTVTMRQAGGTTEFRVADDGPGIEQRFHDKIFVIFQTLSSRDDIETCGVGLATVKRLVTAHGGRVWVESAPPLRGTTIVCTWIEDPR
jgi:PAS domain S-box-containing protein